MGCCLAKKSRENKIKRDTPLLNDHKNNEQRGLSMNNERQDLIQINQVDNNNYNNNGNNNENYEPPQNQLNDIKIVKGKSLIEPPSVDDLHKSDMIEKRGHMVKYFTSLS